MLLWRIIGGMNNIQKEKDYQNLKIKAIKLRKSGKSYTEISKLLSTSKSTLSYWLKSVPLKQEYREKFYTKQIENLSKGSRSQKERRSKEIENVIEMAEKEIITPLSFESYQLMGAALYWAEGSKTKMFEFTNSDPHMILFIIRWIESILKIKSKNLKAALNIYPQQNEYKIKKFWSNLTNIPIKNFGRSYIKPLNNNYKKNNLYYGAIKIMIPKSMDIKHRIFGWIKASLKNIKSDVELTEKKWQSIKETPRPINFKSLHNLMVK